MENKYVSMSLLLFSNMHYVINTRDRNIFSKIKLTLIHTGSKGTYEAKVN